MIHDSVLFLRNKIPYQTFMQYFTVPAITDNQIVWTQASQRLLNTADSGWELCIKPFNTHQISQLI